MTHGLGAWKHLKNTELQDIYKTNTIFLHCRLLFLVLLGRSGSNTYLSFISLFAGKIGKHASTSLNMFKRTLYKPKTYNCMKVFCFECWWMLILLYCQQPSRMHWCLRLLLLFDPGLVHAPMLLPMLKKLFNFACFQCVSFLFYLLYSHCIFLLPTGFMWETAAGTLWCWTVDFLQSYLEEHLKPDTEHDSGERFGTCLISQSQLYVYRKRCRF